MWAPDYATSAELAEYMRIGDDLDSVVLARALSAASRAIDETTGRQFGLVDAAEPRVYRAEFDPATCRWSVPIDDLMTMVDLDVATDPLGDYTFTGDAGDTFVLTPLNAAAKGRPWTRLGLTSGVVDTPTLPDRYVEVTARWGWSDVPATVVQATLIQGSRFASRRDSPYGLAGTGDQAPVVRLFSRVDPDVEAMLRPYRRIWAVA